MKHGKLFSVCLTVIAAIAIFALLQPGQAQAAIEGIYTYELNYENNARIVEVDESASGAIVIPSTLGGYTVTSIYGGAFDNCEKVTSVTIPATVTYFSGYNSNCPKLTKYIVAADNTEYCSDSSGVVYTKDKTELIAIPCGFSGSYTVADGTVRIGASACFYSEKLTSVTIPASATEVSANGFAECPKLTSINVNSGNPVYSSDSRGVLFNKDKTRLMRAPEGLSGSYTIPSGVVTVCEQAFNNCIGLTSVTVPSSVLHIDESAFWNCDSLKYNTYDTGLYLGNSSNPYHVLIALSQYDVTSCTVHSKTKVVAGSACSFSYYLTSVTLPDGIAVIGEDAFDYCEKLKFNNYDNGLYLGNSSKPYLALIKASSETITDCQVHKDTQVIGDFAFYGCEQLKSVTLGGNLREIGENAFAYTGLTSVTLPESITEIRPCVFYCSQELTTVTMGSKVRQIGDQAFAATALTSVTIPETVTKIGYEAFYSCDFTTVDIPASVTHIYPRAFAYNSAMTTLVIPGTVKYIGAEAFQSCYELDLIRFLGNAPTLIQEEACDPVMINTWDKLTLQIPANNTTWTAAAKETVAKDATWVTAKSYGVNAGKDTTIFEVVPVTVGASVSASNFVGVYVDNVRVRSYYYTISGNTTVTLDEEYVEKLRNGTHTISLVFTDGEAATTLTVDREYPGDLDGNSEVNVDDAIYLLQHVLMPGLFPIDAFVDYNGTGAADVDDAVYLLQHVLMPGLFPL